MLKYTTNCALSDNFFQKLKAYVKNTGAEEDVCASNFPLSFRIYFFLKNIYIYFYKCTEQYTRNEYRCTLRTTWLFKGMKIFRNG